MFCPFSDCNMIAILVTAWIWCACDGVMATYVRAFSNDILPDHHNRELLNTSYIGKPQHTERQHNQLQPYPNSGTGSIAVQDQRGLAVEAVAVFYDDLEQAAANRAPILESPLSSSLCRSLIDGLTPFQYRHCRRHPDATAAALDGLRAAVAECQWQMSGRRWNCSGVDGFKYGDRSNSAAESQGGRRIRSPFDHPIAQKGYRESAFIHAILAAGLVTQISRACAAGNLRSCGCLPEVDRRSGQWAWRQCETNVEYADRFARRFIDKHYLSKANDLPYRTHFHNSRVGRRVVKANSNLHCKCHGLSGSCQTKTCWKVAPSLRRVAAILNTKYQQAVLVGGTNSVQVVLTSSVTSVPVSRSSLVFFDRSPSYCDRDVTLGVFGTTGRVCNRTAVPSTTSSGGWIDEDRTKGRVSTAKWTDVDETNGYDDTGSCSTLCCGRGHVSWTVTSYRQCQCQFHWCCRVVCKQCAVTEVVSVCK